MKRKHGWNGLLISGMLGAGGVLMLSGAAATEHRTDYSYAAEMAAEAGTDSEEHLEQMAETESETERERLAESEPVTEENGRNAQEEAELQTESELLAGETVQSEKVTEPVLEIEEEAQPEMSQSSGDADSGTVPDTEMKSSDESEAPGMGDEAPEVETEERWEEAKVPEREQRTEIAGVEDAGQELEADVESEVQSESESEIQVEPPETTESEKDTEGQLQETESEEAEKFETETATTEPEEIEGFETELPESEPEETGKTGTEVSEETEGFETEIAETESGEMEETETEAAATEEIGETETEAAATEPPETELPEPAPPQTEPRPPETEPQPLPVQRGREYEIRGDENAWFRDDRDRLWVRAGSSVYVQALGAMDYGKGGSVSAVQEDGTLTFQLKQMDSSGQIERVSALQKEVYYVDAEAPAAVISGNGEERNGVLYAAQTASLQVAIEPDGKSGLKKAAYCIRNSAGGSGTKAAGQPDIWKECTDGQQVSISEEGIWKVYVRTEDQVGNLKFSESTPICVDRTAPEIRISGVRDQSANSGSLPIQISCEDAYYQPGSLKVSIQGANGGKAPALKKSEESEQGGWMEYFDFPKEQSYDDAYTLTVEASDLSGNRTQKTAEFSVNRFGSVFDLSSDTKKNLKQYYLRHPMDIVFLETNIDYVGASKIFCRENGEVRQLIRGTDYEVTMTGDASSWKQYQYRIPASRFQKEGIYELLLSSEDRANNQSDTGMQGKRVTFALDWTAPECLITGVKDKETYQTAAQTVCFWPQDNIGVRTLKIYKDSELYYQTDTVNTAGLPVKIRLSESEEWQTLQAKVCDFAGNECWTPEIAVYVNAKETGTVPYQRQRKSAQEKEKQEQKSAVLAPQTTRLHTALQLSAAGISGEPYVANAGQIEASQNGNGQKKGEVSAVTKLQQQERQRRGKLFLVFGGLLFLITALVCILPVRKRKT